MDYTISYWNIRLFCYTNAHLINEAKGIILSFTGLGGAQMISDDPEIAVGFAEKGIVYIIPYYNPWCWMNRQTVRYVDVLVDIIIEHFGMKEPKIVSTGGSMGGQCVLIYTAYAKVTPTAAALNCPVCDMPYHYTERPDLPRTMHSAFGGGEDSLSETIEAASPLHLAQKAGLPKIKYLVIHCEADTAVNKERHSDRLTAEMRNHGYDVTYITLPGKNHCDLTPEAYAKYYGFAEEALNG